MKRIWIFILLLGFLTSCNDFLDVTSDTELVEEDLYSDITGVRMAVNGVYKSLSSTDLYGKNLTWGFASAIGHNYQTSSTTYLPTSLYYAAQFDWENAETVTEQIWSKAYNTIAACNDIIQHVEGKDTTFFELGSIEKDMILGEMYGVRAMLHFDIYRSFCTGTCYELCRNHDSLRDYLSRSSTGAQDGRRGGDFDHRGYGTSQGPLN